MFASAAGDDDHPAWYHNLLAHPDVTAEVGTTTLALTPGYLTTPSGHQSGSARNPTIRASPATKPRPTASSRSSASNHRDPRGCGTATIRRDRRCALHVVDGEGRHRATVARRRHRPSRFSTACRRARVRLRAGVRGYLSCRHTFSLRAVELSSGATGFQSKNCDEHGERIRGRAPGSVPERATTHVVADEEHTIGS